MKPTSDLPEIRTLNGKYDARCRLCLRAAWRMWMADEPHGGGCVEGQDDDISRCGAVYNALVSIVIREDHLKKPLDPLQTYILNLLGPKAAVMLANIRAGKAPPNHRPKEPRYDAPKPRSN